MLSEGEGASENHGIPGGYEFPSYFSFLTWGPFAPIDEILSLFLTDDRYNSKGDGSRSQARKSVKKIKVQEAAHDASAVRGFSTDQRISIET